MINIVKAKKEDVDTIRQLFKEYDQEIEAYFPKKQLTLLQKLHPEHGDNPKRRKSILQAISDKNQLFLVAKEEGAVIGCAIGWIEPDTKAGKFDQLILSQHSKKKEILNTLYTELEKWFKKKNCPYVVVDVVVKNPRKHLYKKFGFEATLEEMRKSI